MASRSTRKTWETAFLLSASMSSSYQETFDKARNIMHELGADNVKLGDEAERAAQRQENAFQLAAAAITETGLLELLGKVRDAFSDIVQVTEEFEYTMSAVKAISDAGAEDIAQLEAKARDLGETTVFTARQSAEAMTFMAQAGWDTVEMLEGMDGVISLAAASGTDLAETSSIVADTLAGFGMAADETTRLADVLAQTASHSNTNVSLMGETFKNAAAIAGALGFSIEDVSVMLGVMANAGVKGSRAGTSLRNIFNGLAKDATLTADAFGEVEFSMFDEEGNAKNLIDVVRELRTYFSQMTDKEKYLNASNLAGLRGYNALLAVIGATDEQFEELYADIENADGAAKKMADTRLDNLKGDVTLLESAFESLKITVGEHFMPGGREFVQWLTDATNGINAFVEAHPGAVEGITAITAALGGALGAVTAVAAGIKAIQAVKLVAGLMAGAGASMPIVLGIGAVVGILGVLLGKMAGIREEAQAMYRDSLREAEAIKEYTLAYSEQVNSWKASEEAMKAERKNTDSLINRLEYLNRLQFKTAAQKQEILSIVEILNEEVPDLALAYNEEADSLNLTAEAIRERALAELDAEEIREKGEMLKEALKADKALQDEEAEARELVAKASADHAAAQAAMSAALYGNGDRLAATEQEKAAREALETAQKSLTRVQGARQTNDYKIASLSEQIAKLKNGGELPEETPTPATGPETGYILPTYANDPMMQFQGVRESLPGAGTAYNITADEVELWRRKFDRARLEEEAQTAQADLDAANATYKELSAERNEFMKMYDKYGGDVINMGIEQENDRSFAAKEDALKDVWNKYAILGAINGEMARNEDMIAALSPVVGGYMEAEAARKAEGYTVTVENTINIMGNADEDALEEMKEDIADSVMEGLRKDNRDRTRLSYSGG